jgi:SEC-C motif domain protein
MSCPCQSGKEYTECCEPYHLGQLPEYALTLMRSRYTAYAMGLADYIINTTHPDNTQYLQDRKQWKEQIQNFCDQTQFLGLEILDKVSGEKVCFVTFTAKLEQNGQDTGFTERSRFEWLGGRWLYHSGEFKLGTK